MRLYDHLFTKPDPDDVPEGQDFTANLNPNSLEVLTGCKLEPSLAGAAPATASSSSGSGYFCVDPRFDAGQAGLQPHGDAARHLGEDREEANESLIQLNEAELTTLAACFSKLARRCSRTCERVPGLLRFPRRADDGDRAERGERLPRSPRAQARVEDRASKAVLVFSAHWETADPDGRHGSRRRRRFTTSAGFRTSSIDIRYPAPGAIEAARDGDEAPGRAGILVLSDASRGLDHGAWVPLRLLIPDADVPVSQISRAAELGPRHAYRVGKRFGRSASDGVLIVGSGSITHNLRELLARPVHEAPHVTKFVEWINEQAESGDTEALLDYRRRAPHAVRNHPTEEHLLPFFTMLGAAAPGGRVRRIHRSTTFGSLRMDAYEATAERNVPAAARLGSPLGSAEAQHVLDPGRGAEQQIAVRRGGEASGDERANRAGPALHEDAEVADGRLDGLSAGVDGAEHDLILEHETSQENDEIGIDLAEFRRPH